MPKNNSQKKILLGSHTSSAGGLHLAFNRAASIGSTALQMFVKSNRTWADKPLTDESIALFKEAWESSPIQEVIVHSTYLINIGSKDQATAAKSTKALTKELIKCQQLGIKYLVLHPGSHVGAGEKICLKQIAQNLDLALEQGSGHTNILLETMAGQGTNIGYTFEQLAEIKFQSKHKRSIGICLDTCHIFAAGYDISTLSGYSQTIELFDKILGINNLKTIHLNDSKTTCNSRKDRHEELGKGEIPLEIFKAIMQDKRLVNIPKILETPSDDDMKLYEREIKLLKSFAK